MRLHIRKSRVKPPLLVPEGDLGKPLWERKYPFRAAPAVQVGPEVAAIERIAANAAIDETIPAIRDMVYSRVQKFFPSTDRALTDEIVVLCEEHLAQHSLPRFDADKFTKVSSFAYICVDRFARQVYRSNPRQWRLRGFGEVKRFSELCSADGGHSVEHSVAVSRTHGFLDYRIEAVAADVLANPSKYLTRSQVEVFNTIINSPGIKMKDLAKQFGYQRPSSLSMMLRRIRERIVQIDIEGFSAAT